MKLVAIFILALIGTSYANQAHLKALERIYKDPVGASILSMIALNNKMKTPLEDVAAILQSILSGLIGDSQDFESRTANENDRLTTAIANGESLAAAYQSAIETLLALIDSSNSQLATTQDSLQNLEGALQQEQDTIQTRDAAYAEAIPQYDQNIKDLNAAIDAAGQAKDKFAAYQQSADGSASFIQIGSSIKEHIKKATDIMHAMRKQLSKHSNMFTPLVRELIDLSSSLDQSKADKVAGLLADLIRYLSDSLNDEISKKSQAIQEYDNDNAASQAKVAQLEAGIEQDQAAIAGLEDKIAQAKSDLGAAQQNLADNAAVLAANEASLEALQADYAVRKARFVALIDFVKEIIAFQGQNLSGLDDFVNGKINRL